MEAMSDSLRRLLDMLAARDIGTQAAGADRLHRAALEYREVERLPIVFSFEHPEETPFQPLPNGSIYRDPAAMLYNELVSAWNTHIVLTAELGDDLAPTVRPNWGTVLVASILGGKAEQSGEATPWIRRDAGRPVLLEEIADADPDISTSGWIPRVLETYAAYHEILAPYTELKDALRITLPDLQGPLDTVEQLLGADLFVDMIERPELACRAFLRAAELQVACARIFEPYVRDGPEGFTHQHGFLVKGGILIRCDSAVMISPGHYRDMVAPADALVLSAFGGGGIHSCGRIGHAVPEMLGMDPLRCFDFGQSFMNDVDYLYGAARERRIPFLRVQPGREELADGSILERFPTGVSLHYPAVSFDEARKIFAAYVRNCATSHTARGFPSGLRKDTP